MKLGERLARLALSEIYEMNTECKAPDISIIKKVEPNIIVLEFDNIYQNIDMLGATNEGLPFTIIDENGNINIKSYEVADKNKIKLTLERDLVGKAIVHGAYEKDPKFFLPMDGFTHLPMLSFYGVEIE